MNSPDDPTDTSSPLRVPPSGCWWPGSDPQKVEHEFTTTIPRRVLDELTRLYNDNWSGDLEVTPNDTLDTYKVWGDEEIVSHFLDVIQDGSSDRSRSREETPRYNDREQSR